MSNLLLCEKCHTPKQCRVTLYGIERVVPCLCQCAEDAAQQARAELREQQRILEVHHLQAEGIQDRNLLANRFDTAQSTPPIEKAKKYVSEWQQAEANNLGLLLWGAVGTGKSFLAACIANALIEQGIPVLLTSLPKLLCQIGGMYPQERAHYLDSLSHYRLLILDDFGIERSTDYAMEQIFLIIDERYKSKKPLIITTNLYLDQFRNPSDVAHARIYSRILEMCVSLRVDGDDQRAALRAEKLTATKKLLCETE